MNDRPLPPPKIALGVVAHPDDLEFSVGGSVASWTSQGTKVYYYILTNGNKGSCDRTVSSEKLITIRRDEQRAAAKVLGVTECFFADYEDGALYNTQEVKKDIVRMIRQIRPDVVMTFDPSMLYHVPRGFVNHPDHRAAGQATLDAVFPLARDHLSFPELFADGLEPHKVHTVLLNNFANQNCFIDITDTLETKLEALCAHESQIPDMQASRELIINMAEEAGERIGVKYAEGFLRIDIN